MTDTSRAVDDSICRLRELAMVDIEGLAEGDCNPDQLVAAHVDELEHALMEARELAERLAARLADDPLRWLGAGAAANPIIAERMTRSVDRLASRAQVATAMARLSSASQGALESWLMLRIRGSVPTT